MSLKSKAASPRYFLAKLLVSSALADVRVEAKELLLGTIALLAPVPTAGLESQANTKQMTEKKYGRCHWLHTLEEKWFLPALTAYVANYLLRGQLKPLAEQLPEPWADVIAHPFIEFLLDFLLWLAVFLGTLVVKKAVKYYALTFFTLVGILHFVLLRYAHASKLSLYVLWCSVVWGTAALLLWRLARAVKSEAARTEEASHSRVPHILVPDEDGVPTAISDDEPVLFGEGFSEVLTLMILSGLVSVLATLLLALTLWASLGLTATRSIVLSLIAGSILAIVYRRIIEPWKATEDA